MNSIRSSAVACALVGLAGAAFVPKASAAIVITWEADLSLWFGTDVNGLEGAHVRVDLTIADGEQYVGLMGSERVEADVLDAQMTITGASIASSNGTFGLIAGGGADIRLTPPEFPGENPSFYAGADGNASNQGMVFDLPGADLAFSMNSDQTPATLPLSGQTVSVADLPSSASGSVSNYSDAHGGTDPAGVYNENNQTFTVVPAPGAVGLLAFVGVATIGRRRR